MKCWGGCGLDAPEGFERCHMCEVRENTRLREELYVTQYRVHQALTHLEKWDRGEPWANVKGPLRAMLVLRGEE